MKLAVSEAREGIHRGDGRSFGRVTVKDGEIIAIRDTGHRIGSFDLSEAELYTTGEPCPMCPAGCLSANVRVIRYGCTRTMNGSVFTTKNSTKCSAAAKHLRPPFGDGS